MRNITISNITTGLLLAVVSIAGGGYGALKLTDYRIELVPNDAPPIVQMLSDHDRMNRQLVKPGSPLGGEVYMNASTFQGRVMVANAVDPVVDLEDAQFAMTIVPLAGSQREFIISLPEGVKDFQLLTPSPADRDLKPIARLKITTTDKSVKEIREEERRALVKEHEEQKNEDSRIGRVKNWFGNKLAMAGDSLHGTWRHVTGDR